MEITTKEELHSALKYLTSLSELSEEIIANADEKISDIEKGKKLLNYRPRLNEMLLFNKLKRLIEKTTQQYNNDAAMFNALSSERCKVAEDILTWCLINEPEQKELINKLKSLVNLEKTLTIKSLSI